MINKVIAKFVMWWCGKECKKYGKPIYYIKGTGKDYPNYLLFTNDKEVYHRMDKF